MKIVITSGLSPKNTRLVSKSKKEAKESGKGGAGRERKTSEGQEATHEDSGMSSAFSPGLTSVQILRIYTTTKYIFLKTKPTIEKKWTK